MPGQPKDEIDGPNCLNTKRRPDGRRFRSQPGWMVRGSSSATATAESEQRIEDSEGIAPATVVSATTIVAAVASEYANLDGLDTHCGAAIFFSHDR